MQNNLIIEFPGPAVKIVEGVSFRALVNSKTVACLFMSKLLQDIDPSNRMADALDQFELNRPRLLSIAERKIRRDNIAEGAVYFTEADLHS